MAMQLDEQPIGAAEHADLRLLPEREPVHGRGFRSGESTVVESGPGKTQRAPEVGYERTLHDERKSFGRASHNQVVPLAVRRCLIEWKATFVDGINLFRLCRMPVGGGQGQVGVAAGLS